MEPGDIIAGNETMHRQVLDLLQGGLDGTRTAVLGCPTPHADGAVLLPLLCHHCGRFIADLQGRRADAMARDLDPFKLSSPRIFLVRMLVFLILCGLVLVVLYKQIMVAFMANPGLNALIIAVLVIGILLAFRQVIRLFPEVAWVNGFRLADPGLAVARAAGAARPDGDDPRRPRRPHRDLRRPRCAA